VGGQEFDVAELSASEFISLIGRGDCPFVALPVFPSRVFRYGYIFINTRRGIRTPKDLEGKRVGLPLYTQTAAIWARGAIDALIGRRNPDDRGRHPDVARLFPDYRLLERQLYQRSKIFPIMHLIAMRRDLYERQRWIAESLYNAFVESKHRARSRMRYAG